MDKEVKKDSKLVKKIERIPLSDQSLQIVNKSITEMKEKYPDASISKKQLVNWVISEFFKKLSPQTEKTLHKKFYDEEKFLADALKEIKKRKAKGEDYSYQDYVRDKRPKREKKTPPKSQNSSPLKTISQLE